MDAIIGRMGTHRLRELYKLCRLQFQQHCYTPARGRHFHP